MTWPSLRCHLSQTGSQPALVPMSFCKCLLPPHVLHPSQKIVGQIGVVLGIVDHVDEVAEYKLQPLWQGIAVDGERADEPAHLLAGIVKAHGSKPYAPASRHALPKGISRCRCRVDALEESFSANADKGAERRS